MSREIVSVSWRSPTLLPGHVDADAVLAPVRFAVPELGAVVEVGDLVDLLDPPVRLLEHEVVRWAPVGT